MKETKVYVDELPKSCGCCEFYSQDKYCAYCLMLNEKLRYIDKDKDCPLKSLHEYKKALVTKVCERIKEQLGFIVDKKERVICDGSMTGDKTILAVLKQIQKEFEK